MAQIVVVGSCVQDLISYTPRFPKPGESVRGHRFQMGFGGKGANAAVAAAKLGAHVAMVARVGDDIFGHSAIQNFASLGIEHSNVTITDDASTATATITVDDKGENSIVVVLGANERLRPDDVAKAHDVIAQCKVLLCQLEVPQETDIAALRLAKELNITTIFNAAPGLPNINEDFYALSDIICVNENEAEMITGIHDVKNGGSGGKALDRLLAKGVKMAILTLGAKGSLFKAAGDATETFIPSHKVEPVVDTTGAGDCFVGSLAYFITAFPELSMAERIRRASIVAAHSVQHPGTQSSYPSRSDLAADLFV